MDWNGKPLELYGETDVVAHRRIDINYLPCEPKQITEANKHLQKTECLVDLKDKKALKRRLKKTKKYLRQPHMVVITNTERIDVTKYDEKIIIKESIVLHKQINVNEPSWIQGFLSQYTLKDETDFVNLGFEVVKHAMAFEMTHLIASSWTNYPGRYKFIGLQINVKETRRVTHRQTYGLLEFGGEIGGNFEFIKVTGFLIAKVLVTFNFLALIANRMYIWEPPTQEKIKKQKKNPRI
jgi:hypothetical protein